MRKAALWSVLALAVSGGFLFAVAWKASAGSVSVTAKVPGTCGNGVIEVDEECDRTNLDGQTCISRGYATGTLVCTGQCKLDTSACVPLPPAPPAGGSGVSGGGGGGGIINIGGVDIVKILQNLPVLGREPAAAKGQGAIDLNQDGKIGIADLSVLLYWADQPAGSIPQKYDLNGDGHLDLSDISILLYYWND